MIKYKFKEKDYVDEILNNGFTSKHILSELKLLAKYFKSLSKREDEIKLLLQDFCKKYLKGYNEAVHFKIINNATTYGNNAKNKLIQIDSVNISKNELDLIEKMNISHDYKRVVFTLLVLTKLNKKSLEIKDGEVKSKEFYFGGFKNFRELVSVSKITFSRKKSSNVKSIHDLIHLLDEKEIVKITGNGNVKLLFMYDIQEDDNIAITVNDFTVIGLYYDLYFKENKVKECECCRVPIKIKGKNHKFCVNCSNKIEKEKIRKRVEKYRLNTL